MNILDPLSGNTVVIDLAKERERAHQRRCNMARLRNEKLPRPVPVLDPEYDEEAGRFVPTVHIDRDPGDER